MDNKKSQKPDIIHKINENIMKFKYSPFDTSPGIHIGLNPHYLQMRQEIHHLHKIHLKARKKKMRELLCRDFLQENKELGQVQFGYINTQP